MAVKSFIKKVGQKAKDGSLTLPYSEFGVGFDNVVDTRSGKGNYSLAQFFDNYMDYMKNTTFVYTGKTQPTNTHVGIWIDTSSSNQ
jgi:hypothetical protein